MDKVSIKQEQDWQAEADADTMARYNEILADKARKQRAMAKAKKKAADLMTRLTAMKKVANS